MLLRVYPLLSSTIFPNRRKQYGNNFLERPHKKMANNEKSLVMLYGVFAVLLSIIYTRVSDPIMRAIVFSGFFFQAAVMCLKKYG